MLVFLLWLNGPGIRWLLPIAARHFLEKKTMAVEMEVRGSLTSGLTLHDVELVGGPVAGLRISSVEPLYRLRELIDGKVRGLHLKGIELEMDLDRTFANATAAEPAKPFDIRELAELLRENHGIAAGYEVEVQVKALKIHRSEEMLALTQDFQLSHATGEEAWKIETGEWQLPKKRNIPAQSLLLSWSQNLIGLEQFRFDERIRLEDLRFTTPADLRPLMSARMALDDSMFSIQTTENFARVDLLMSGQPLSLTQLQPYLRDPLPVEGTIAAFSLRVEPKNLPIFGEESPRPMTFDAKLQTQMQSMQWDDWKLDTLDLTLSKVAEKAELVGSIAGYDGEVKSQASVLWNQDPTRAEDWQRATITYDVGIPELKNLLENLAPQMGLNRPEDAVAPPASSLQAKGSLRIDGATLGAMELILQVNPLADALPSLNLTARSAEGKNFLLESGFGALSVKGSLDREAMTYEAEFSAKELDPQSYQPWVSWAGIALPTGMNASLSWQGRGDMKALRHSGQAKIGAFSWKRADADALTASGEAKYDWPQQASVENLLVNMGDQKARMNVNYAGERLELRELELRKKDQKVLSGVASIPVAQSVKSLREFLLQTQDINVKLTSEVLPLSMAEQWLKPGEQLPVTGTAQVELHITGSPADPVIAGNLQLKNAKSRSNADLPAVDLSLDLQTKQQQLALSGLLLTARTAPVQLKAEMPFRPGAWAEDVQLIQGEKIDARVEIPTLDLARFQDLVPQVTQLAGTLTGNVVIKGTVSAPRINGALSLKNFSARLPNEKVPPLSDGSMNLTFADQLLTLEKLSLSLAGGGVTAQGKADLTDFAKPVIDFTIRGDALPLWRDDAVIARANANLRIAGPWDLVRTSGEIGIIDSLLYKDFEIIPIGRPFTLPQAASLPALDGNLSKKADALPLPFANWPLAIQIKTTDPFLIRGNLARGSITADVKVGGTLGNPQPVGEAVITELAAALPLSKLTISSGKVRLSAATGLDPVLDIRGASRVSNYDISLYVYGPVSAPQMLLTSEPPLPENEIMTLLATGTTTEGLTDQGAAQSKATQLLIEEFRRGRLPLGQKLMPLLSQIENVELAVGEPDPYTGRKFASAKLPLFSRYFLYGAVDALGRTRSLFLFEVKMK